MYGEVYGRMVSKMFETRLILSAFKIHLWNQTCSIIASMVCSINEQRLEPLESMFYRNEIFRLKIVFRKLKMLYDVIS